MSVTLQFTFPGGRYHATPWGHHVNEGLIEWPPSPWRLLRALVAVWHRTMPAALGANAEDTAQSEELLRGLLKKLAAERPSFWLPKTTPSHTRHYMPLGTLKDGDIKTTLVFDAFLQVKKNAPLIVMWPSVDLDDNERALLQLLVERMPYLGRRESWVQGELVSELPSSVEKDDSGWVRPFDSDEVQTLFAEKKMSPADYESVRTLTPLPDDAVFAQADALRAVERKRKLAEKLAKERTAVAKAGREEKPIKLSKKDEAAVHDLFPDGVWDALLQDTSALQKAGLSGVPGTVWVDYARPRTLTEVPRPRRQQRAPKPATVARFEVTSQVPPQLFAALRVGDAMRRSLLKLSDGAPCFVGRDDDNTPAKGEHRHAMYLSQAGRSSEGGVLAVRHITVVAPMGFDIAARAALGRLRRLWGEGIGDERHDIQLALVGIGQPHQFDDPMFHAATRWASHTPFISTRHIKKKRNDHGEYVGSAPDDLRRLLHLWLSDNGHEGVQFELTDAGHSVRPLRGRPTYFSQFQTHRARRQGGAKGARGTAPPLGFEVTFSTAVCGPLAVGYGAHFGMGLFEPHSG